MLASIKSKIVVLTLSLLIGFGLLIAGAAIFAFYQDKELIIAGNGHTISSLTGRVNQEITGLEKNALDLALMGEVYYQKGKQQSIGEFFTKEILKNYPHSMGNGLYFLPYKVDNDQKIFCIHAVWDEEGKIGMLPSCEDGTFNYFGQNWYAEIMKDMQKGKRVSWVRPYRSTQLGNLMTTVGAGIYQDKKLVGFATVDWQMDDILASILKVRPTPNSFALFADTANDYIIATTEPGVKNRATMGKSLKTLKWYSDELKEGVPFDYQGKKYIPYVKRLDNGLSLIINVPLFELFHDAVRHILVLVSVLLISVIIIVGVLYQVLRRNINQPISKLTRIAGEISRGNLAKTIYLDKPLELAQLANAFNKMKTDIRAHLTELAKVSNEKQKIESELAIAHTIQAAAVPTDFPQNESFDLIASMTPAREVGGDFYDFFPIDEEHFAFVMADVSGKGITAALYMMSAKAMIKNMLQAGYPLADAMNRANKGLCDNHARGMFVTAFIGILNVRTGLVQYVNAGHCPPLHRTKNGYEYVTVVRNLVLGITPNYKYESGEFTLGNGDRLFLYTDGVTEAQTRDEKLFGPERLEKALNQKELSLPETLNHVRKAIGRFVKGADQSDDITMMILAFRGKKVKNAKSSK